MIAFVVRRLLSVVAVMVGVSALVFSVFYVFRPERVADGTGYLHQLAHFLERAFLHLDLGRSTQRQLSFQPVVPLLRQSIPADLSLVLGGLVVGTAAGIALGAVAQQRRGTYVGRGLEGFAAFAMSAPVYWLGAMAVVLFHPEVGRVARLPISKPNTYAPLTADPLAWLQSLWLPWIILGLPLAAITMRMMRATLAETLDEDFVRTARGKGLTPVRVLRHHAIPAASAPVISLVGVTMGTIITNAILLEYTFSIPGMFSPHDARAGRGRPAGRDRRGHRGRAAGDHGEPAGRPRARLAGPPAAHGIAARGCSARPGSEGARVGGGRDAGRSRGPQRTTIERLWGPEPPTVQSLGAAGSRGMTSLACRTRRAAALAPVARRVVCHGAERRSCPA